MNRESPDQMRPKSVAVPEAATNDIFVDEARDTYRSARRAHWNAITAGGDRWTDLGGYYHRRLTEVYQFLVPPGQSVIELGCWRGDLLAALKPEYGRRRRFLIRGAQNR